MQTDHELEELLRKAPAPPTPFGLEQRLVQQASRPARNPQRRWSWFSILQERSWAPALALFAVMAGLLTAVAFQQNTLNELNNTQKELSAQKTPAEEPSQTPASGSSNNELDVLRKQAAELRALRAEMADIEKMLARQGQISAANAALRTELSKLTRNNPEASPEIQSALAEARKKAERIRCVNNLKNIGLAARIWSTDNGDAPLPKDFITMKNELSTPKILVCPADPARGQGPGVETWEQFTSGSYDLLSPNISVQVPNAVYVRCPFHNNVLLVDGSVQQLQPAQQVVQRNGYWEVQQ